MLSLLETSIDGIKYEHCAVVGLVLWQPTTTVVWGCMTWRSFSRWTTSASLGQWMSVFYVLLLQIFVLFSLPFFFEPGKSVIYHKTIYVLYWNLIYKCTPNFTSLWLDWARTSIIKIVSFEYSWLHQKTRKRHQFSLTFCILFTKLSNHLEFLSFQIAHHITLLCFFWFPIISYWVVLVVREV